MLQREVIEQIKMSQALENSMEEFVSRSEPTLNTDAVSNPVTIYSFMLSRILK